MMELANYSDNSGDGNNSESQSGFDFQTAEIQDNGETIMTTPSTMSSEIFDALKERKNAKVSLPRF